MKRIVLFAFLCVAAGSVAAPVPKASTKEKMEAIFGKLEDPEGKCDFQLDGTKLTIGLPGGKEYMCYKEKQNAPRFTRTVEGDFTITVKCSAELPKGAKQADGKWAEVGCGLYIKPKEDEVERLGLSDFISEGKNGSTHNQVVLMPISYGPSGLHFKDTGNSVYVRFSRTGKRIEYSSSGDGKKFTVTMSSDKDSGEPYELGVYACSNCTEKTRAVLEDFKLELLPAKKK